MEQNAELRDWGRGYCVVRVDPDGDAVDVDRLEAWDQDPVPRVRVLAVCPTRDAAEAALRLANTPHPGAA